MVGQLARAVQQLLRAVVQLLARVDDLIRLFGQFAVVHIDVQRKPYAIDRNRIHLKIRRVGGNQDGLLGVRQHDIAQLPVGAHVRLRRALGGNISTVFRIQQRGDLQRVALEQLTLILGIPANVQLDLHMAAFAGQILGGDFLPVQPR